MAWLSSTRRYRRTVLDCPTVFPAPTSFGSNTTTPVESKKVDATEPAVAKKYRGYGYEILVLVGMTSDFEWIAKMDAIR
jgi:hypothetical protein